MSKALKSDRFWHKGTNQSCFPNHRVHPTHLMVCALKPCLVNKIQRHFTLADSTILPEEIPDFVRKEVFLPDCALFDLVNSSPESMGWKPQVLPNGDEKNANSLLVTLNICMRL